MSIVEKLLGPEGVDPLEIAQRALSAVEALTVEQLESLVAQEEAAMEAAKARVGRAREWLRLKKISTAKKPRKSGVRGPRRKRGTESGTALPGMDSSQD